MHITFHRLAVATAFVLALGAVLFDAAPASAQAAAQTQYERTLAREEAARKAARPNLATLRSIAVSYENIPRRYPRSGYSDNALWQGAGLLQLAWEHGGTTRDRDQAIKLLDWLRKEYPSSSLVRQVSGRLAALRQPRASQHAEVRGAPAPPAPTHQAAVAAAPAPAAAEQEVPAPKVATTEAPQPDTSIIPTRGGPPIAVRGLSHTVLPRGDRLTFELNEEAAFNTERRDGSNELTLTLSDASAAAAIINAANSIRGTVVQSVRLDHDASGLRVSVVLDGQPRYSAFPLYGPHRLVVDLEAMDRTTAASSNVDAQVGASRPVPQPIPTASRSATRESAVATSEPSAPVPAASTAAPIPAGTTTVSTPPAPDVRAAAAPDALESIEVDTETDIDTPRPIPPASTSAGGYSLARQLGLSVSRIVIDPGHGGSDPGAQANGVTEASVVLDIALRLEKLLLAEPGFDVVLTRRTNQAVPLARRTAIANEQAADLFLSIHANSSPRTQTAGVETYILNFSSNQHASAVAARENASSSEDMHLLPQLIRSIATNNKLDESRELASMVQSSLVRKLRPRNRGFQDLGVKQAPFMVLIGAQMPSVLAEVAFVSNRTEATLLKQTAYRQQVAQALFDAVVQYRNSLKKVATMAASAEGR